MNINDILSKLSELRAVFVLGQRSLPFIEEVFYFLKEISPLLDDINASIRESTTKMPRATSQLQSVTQATELATTEILDLTDVVLSRVGAMKVQNERRITGLERLAASDDALLELILAANVDPAVQARVRAIHDQKKAVREELVTELRSELPLLDDIRDKMNRIMISLQVQDITSQQIAAVNHLIESIRRRMAQLVQRLGTKDIQSALDDFSTPTGVAFDPNAQYDISGTRQTAADEVIAAFASGAADAAPTVSSQADIDALFGGAGKTTPAASAPSGPASQSDIDALFGAPAAAAPAAQADIDALFGGGGGDGPASQTDIDKLFGGGEHVAGPASQADIDKLFGGGA